MFKLLKKLLLWPPVLLTLVYLALLLLTWLLLPVLMSAATREEREVVQLGVTVGLGLLWAVAMVATLYRSLRRHGLRLPALPKGAPRASGGVLDALRAERAVALDALDRIPDAGAWPRLAIIGPAGAGKSGALLRCGQAPTRLDGRSTPYQPRADELCAWVRCGSAVYLDTSGRLVEDDAARETWRALLQALRETRRDPPLDGIVVVVSLADLLGRRADADARILADRLRGRLDDAVEILGQAPPFHLVLTHGDALAGFSDFLHDLGAQHGSRPLGRAVDAEAQRGPEQAGEARKTLDDLVLRLERRALHALSSSSEQRLLTTLLMPAQLGAARAAVEALVGHLTRKVGSTERATLAGLWITGLAAPVVEVDQVSQTLDARFRLSPGLDLGRPTPGLAARPGEGRPLFLAGLFTDVFPRSAGAGALTRREAQQQEARAHRRLRLLLAAVLLFALVVGTFGVLNLRYLRGLESRWDAVVSTLRDERPGSLPHPALSAELALLGAWGAPGWRLPGGTAERQREVLSEDQEDAEPPMWLARTWLWPSRLRVASAVEERVLDLVQERLVGEVSRLAREDLLRLAATAPGPNPPPGSATKEDWLVDAQASLELSRRWRALYERSTEGVSACEDGTYTQDEEEVARWLARRIALARRSSDAPSLEGTIADEDEAAELDAWLLGRLFDRGSDRCAALARLVPTAKEAEPIEAILRDLDPSEAVFALLFSRVNDEVEARWSRDPQRPRLQISSKILRASSTLRAAPPGYDLLSCQSFQVQLYLLEHEDVGSRLLDKGRGAAQGGLDGLRGVFGSRGVVAEEPLVTWGEIERLTGELTTPEQRKELLGGLRQRYESNHARQWKERWLQHFSVPDPRTQALTGLGLLDLVDELRALYGPQGAVSSALSLLGRGQPAYLPVSADVDVALKRANQRCNALAAVWRGAHGLVDGGEQSTAAAAFADQTQKMQDLAVTLEGVAADADKRGKLVLETYDDNSALKSAWLAANDVERQLDLATQATHTLPDPTQLPVGEDEARRLVQDLFAGQVSRTALFLVWGRLLQDFEQDVESDWRAEVMPAWTEMSGSFPFTPASSAMLDAGAAGELFGEGGTVDSFLEGQLAPWVGAGETRLRGPEPLGPQAPSLLPTPELSRLVTERRERWRAIASLSKPLEFRLTPSNDPRHTGPVTEAVATVGAQELRWRWETPPTYSFSSAFSDPAHLQVSGGDQRERACADTQGVGRDAGRPPLTVLQTFGRNAWLPSRSARHYYVVFTSRGFVRSSEYTGNLLDPCQVTWILDDDGRGPVSLYAALSGLGLRPDLLRYVP